MNQATAVRVGDDISLTYRGQWLSFKWYCDSLFIATNANGDIWAYDREPVFSSATKQGWDSIDMLGTEEPVHYMYKDIVDWKDSLVEYTIK